MTTILDKYNQTPLSENPAGDDLVPFHNRSTGKDEPGTYDILVRDPLRQAVEAQTGGRITVLYDDNDAPNYMHVLPRFRYEDLGFGTELGTGDVSAFVVNGKVKPEVFIGAYQADSNAQSLPFSDPQINVDYDSAVSQCTTKGSGWHLMTAHEWAAVAFWCMANGFEPRGNTDNGRAHDATHEVGRRQDGGQPGDSNGTGNIYTGSGEQTWRHNGGPSGIADLVGNVREWNFGLKLVDGEIFATADNQYDQAEANWPSAGRFLANDPGTPTLADSGMPNESYDSVDWANTLLDSGYTPSQLLARLLIEPVGIEPQGRLEVRDFDERLPIRGGSRVGGGGAGLASLYLYGVRGFSNGLIGFRPAYIA